MNSALTIDLIEPILIISSYSALIPLSLSIFGWKRLSFDLKILSAYLLFSIVIDLTTSYFAHRGVNNHFLLYLLTIIEFSIFSYLYFRFFAYANLRKLVIGITLLFFAFLAYYGLKEGINNYATIPRTFESIIFTVYAITFLFLVLKEDGHLIAKEESAFWINSGVLVYFAGLLLFNSLSSYILNNADLELQRKLFITPSILNILQKILFTVSIWISIMKK